MRPSSSRKHKPTGRHVRDGDTTDATSFEVGRRGSVSSEAEASILSETKVINVLRVILFLLLVLAAVVVSVGVYRLTKDDETTRFQDHVEANARRILESFHDTLERKMGAINSMATAITSIAMATQQQFPFVTVPDFEMRGADVRTQTGGLIVHYMPIVEDEQREEWEEYALANRGHIDQAYDSDLEQRNRQDEAFGLQLPQKIQPGDGGATGGNKTRALREETNQKNKNMLDDGTRYHPRIWSWESKDVAPEDSGPYLPLWQRSPMNAGKQFTVNLNFDKGTVFEGILPNLLKRPEALINRGTSLELDPEGKVLINKNLAIGQFRHQTEKYANDPLSFLAYPIMDSFQQDRKVVGVLGTNLYWRMFFQSILPADAMGFICVLENSYNQTFSYRLDGPDVTYLGQGDLHDAAYAQFESSTDINEYVRRNAGPDMRSYTAVPLNTEVGKYILRVYPSKETENGFLTNKPWLYTAIVVAIFSFTSFLFALFVYVVERRQKLAMARVLESAENAAAAERDLK